METLSSILIIGTGVVAVILFFVLMFMSLSTPDDKQNDFWKDRT